MISEQRLIRDKIHQLLGWGTAALLLVTGFALNKPELFELFPPPYYEEFRSSHQSYSNFLSHNRELEPGTQLRNKVKAIKIQREILEEENKVEAAKYRAWGLLIGTTIFVITWPTLLHLLYSELDKKDKATPTRGLSMFYSIIISSFTLVIAFLVCYI